MTRRSTVTITVLSALSLTTTPWRTRFGMIYPLGPHALGVLKLAAGALKTKIERLLAELFELGLEFVGGLGANVAGLHGVSSIPTRVTIRVPIGSLAAPSRKASRARGPGTPSSSNRMRPGFTRQTQNSGVPLPLPMRTSAGFCDTGTSGKMRIHTRPTRRM